MKTSLRPPTRYEAERIEAMLKLGCVACAQLGIPYAEVQCHHILDGGVRMGHWFSLGLCAGHHKGEFTALQQTLVVEVAQERGIRHDPLVAIHTGRKAFARVYGTERELWVRVQGRLRLPAIWPPTKILPRRSYVESNPQLVAPGLDPIPPTPAFLPRSPALGDRAGEGSEAVGGTGEAQ